MLRNRGFCNLFVFYTVKLADFATFSRFTQRNRRFCNLFAFYTVKLSGFATFSYFAR